jgi:O-antigen ligase
MLVTGAIVALPLLRPTGPGNITPSDLLMGVSILGVIWWAGTERIPFHLPYAVPMGILIVAGGVAAQFSVAPASGMLAIGQDAFLLVWAGAIATFCRTPENLSVMLRAWSWSAGAWATVVIAAVLSHRWWLVGANGDVGGRAQLWFDNPNMAGNYFLVSLFVVLLGRHPRRPWLRAAVCAALVAAIVLTGSNAALLSLALGAIATALVVISRRVDLLNAIVIVALVGFVVFGAAFSAVRLEIPQRISQSSNELISKSLARGPRSAAGRSTLFSEGFQLYRTGSLLGRGPASTKANLELGDGSIVKEAHDDYLAALVERGPIGVVGLIVLLAGIWVRAFSVAFRPLAAPWARMLANPAAAIGVVVTLLVTSTTHELLHYRHVWALLGILAALHLYGRVSPRPSLDGAPA